MDIDLYKHSAKYRMKTFFALIAEQMRRTQHHDRRIKIDEQIILRVEGFLTGKLEGVNQKNKRASPHQKRGCPF
jgi:hypothetical protein